MDLQERIIGKVVVVDVRGLVKDVAAHTILHDKVRSLLAQGYKSILLNVAEVTYVDSVWLGARVEGYVSAMRHGVTLKLLHGTSRLRELLRVTRLDTVLDLFESEEDAAASFGADADPIRGGLTRPDVPARDCRLVTDVTTRHHPEHERHRDT